MIIQFFVFRWHMRVQEKTWTCLELARNWQELATWDVFIFN